MKHFPLLALLTAALLGHPTAGQALTVLGETWTLQYPSPSPENLHAIAVNGTTLVVAVGAHGTIVTAASLDSSTTNWTLRTSGVTADLRDVIYTGSKFIAVGSSGTVLTSTNGTAWTKITSGLTTTDHLKAVVWDGSNKLVVVGETTAGAGVTYASTAAGTAWTRKTIASTTTLLDVTYTGNFYLAAMKGAILKSYDGIAWTTTAYSGLIPKSIVADYPPISPATTATYSFVTGNANLRSANGTSLPSVATSAPVDLSVNWTTDKFFVGVTRTGELWQWDRGNLTWQQITTQAGAAFNAVSKFGVQYVAVGDRGVIYSYTPDASWVNQPQAVAENLQAITLNGSTKLVAVGDNGAIVTANVSNSAPAGWAAATSSVTTDLRDVIYMGTQFVAVGEAGTLLTSTNGTTWTAKTSPSATDNLYAVTWAGGTKLLAVGETSGGVGVAYVSTDSGDSWTSQTIVGTTTLLDVTWTGTNYMAIMTGAVLTSADGVTWSTTSFAGLAPKSIASDFVAPSTTATNIFVTGSTTLQSTNGAALATATSLAPTNLALNYNGTNFIGITSAGEVWFWNSTSAAWQKLAASPSTGTYNAVARVGTQFVAVGNGGVVKSYVGTAAWVTQSQVGTKNVATSIATDGTSVYVAVGIDMTWTSPDGESWTPHSQTSKAMYSVVWTGTKFVASGTTASTSGNALWSSPDGITWTEQNPPAPDAASKKIYALAHLDDGNTYVLGYDGTKHQTKLSLGSTGFSTFTALPSQWAMLGINKSATGLLANDLLVAVGWGGRTLTSKAVSPLSWTERVVALATGEDFTDITWAKVSATDSRFVAVTNKGGIWTSANGTSGWTKRHTAPKALWCITRTANQFIAAGDGGILVESFGGDYWVEGDVGTSGWINQINYLDNKTNTTPATTGRLVAVGGYGTFLTTEGTFPVQPEVNFSTAASTMAEAGGTSTIRITLSQAWPVNVVVSLAYTGSTATTADYKGNITTATIPTGVLFKDFTLTAISDAVVENDQKIKLTLSSATGDVKVGTSNVHTVTITDNEPPTFITPPASALVALGNPVNSLTSDSTGTPLPTWQWYKNNVAISGATSSAYPITSARLADAGAYVLRLKNIAGTLNSSPAQVGVVDTTNLSATATAGGNATLSFDVAGNVTYQWFKGSTLLTGKTAKTLALTNVQAANEGDYHCTVTLGSDTLDSGTITLTIVSTAPTIASTGIAAGSIFLTYQATPTLTGSVPASSWTITGLPAGLTYNVRTGIITGTPTRAGSFPVRVIASNAFGNSAALTPTLLVNTGALGTFMAVVDGQTDVNQNLGGRIDLTTTIDGRYTAKLNDVGNVNTSFTGALNLSGSTVTVGITAGAKTITLNLDAVTGAVTGTVDVTLPAAASAPVIGWRKAAASAVRAGYYTFALNPASSTAGSGYGRFTVDATGALTVLATLPDSSTTYTISSFTGPNGEFGLYSRLYSNAGSVYGRLRLNEVLADSATNFINGSASWSTTSAASSTLTADGGRYIAPVKPGIVMALLNTASNLKAAFTGADLATSSRNPDRIFSVTSPATVATPTANAATTSLSFTYGNGLFSGAFEMLDGAQARHSDYYGVLIRPAGNSVMLGKGFFLLPEKLPGNATQSGAVNLTRNP